MVPKTENMQQEFALIHQKEAETDRAIARIEKNFQELVPVVMKQGEQIGQVTTFTEVLAEGAKNTNAQMAQMQMALRGMEDKFLQLVERNAAEHASLGEKFGGMRAEMLVAVNTAVTEARKSDASLQQETQQVANQSRGDTLGLYKVGLNASLQLLYILLGAVVGFLASHIKF